MTLSVKILCWVAFSIMICFSQLAAATMRGLKRVVVEDSSGNKIRLYSQSHALVIGVSDYQVAGWPNLESVKGDVSSVRSLWRVAGSGLRQSKSQKRTSKHNCSGHVSRSVQKPSSVNFQ